MGQLPPAVNVEAKGGTVMLMDGRLLHGTGVNHTDEWRYIMTNSNFKPWLRQQENWQLSVDPEVLRTASDKLLQRMGFHSSGLIEIATYSGPKTTRALRLAMERGDYQRIREMRSPVPEDVRDGLGIHRMKKEIDAAAGPRRWPKRNSATRTAAFGNAACPNPSPSRIALEPPVACLSRAESLKRCHAVRGRLFCLRARGRRWSSRGRSSPSRLPRRVRLAGCGRRG